MRTGLFLQARIGSQRLPRKALLPLDGLTVLEAAMRALAQVPADIYAVLTDAASAAEFRPLAERCGFEVFVGPEEDVLERFCLAVGEYRVERVVRATGDNPLVSPAQVQGLLRLQGEEDFDLGHYLGPPLGTGVEVVRAAALIEAGAHAVEPFEREHITTHLYRNRDRFRVVEPTAPSRWCLAEGRVTVDTEEDYHRVRALFAELYRGAPIETEEVVTWLRGQQS